ncbi:MAG TPA: hypothetical protein VEL11_18675 [Candidatus Bathyarchaeia archaeon]|nr:hypothetical protein [Candidatus Bathyarchaeia archaeon]
MTSDLNQRNDRLLHIFTCGEERMDEMQDDRYCKACGHLLAMHSTEGCTATLPKPLLLWMGEQNDGK